MAVTTRTYKDAALSNQTQYVESNGTADSIGIMPIYNGATLIGPQAKASALPFTRATDDVGVQFVLTPAAPTPSGTDIVNASGTSITSGDLTIRDTNVHSFFIPMLQYTYCQILIAMDSTALDQNVACSLSAVRAVGATGSQNSRIQLASFTVLGSTFPMQFGFVSEYGTVATGGVTGADPTTVYAVYSSSLIKTATFLWLTLTAAGVPTAGQFQAISIARKR